MFTFWTHAQSSKVSHLLSHLVERRGDTRLNQGIQQLIYPSFNPLDFAGCVHIMRSQEKGGKHLQIIKI